MICRAILKGYCLDQAWKQAVTMRTTSRMGMALMRTWTRLMRRAQGQMPMVNQKLKTLKLVGHSASQMHGSQRQNAQVRKLKASQHASLKA